METLETLHWRLTSVENRVGAMDTRVSSAPSWVDPNLTEPQVQYALDDLCQSNSVVFDVGANFGGLALTMSRKVGPRGAVCAFEANPLITTRCQANLNAWGCGNTQLYNNAIFARSGGMLDLYVSDNMVSDSLYNRVSDRTVKVPGLALDDFVERTGLVPSLIKMDIEGAEYDALVGMERTLARERPIFILEQRPSEVRCLAFLRERGYAAVDLRTYRPVERMDDLPPETEVTDLLFMPADDLARTPYAGTATPSRMAELGEDRFTWHGQGHFASSPTLLPAGRYLVDADFSGEGGQEFKVGVARNGCPVMMYHGTSVWLTRVGRSWVFDLSTDDEVTFFFDYPAERDPAFRFTSLTVSRMPGFPWIGLPPA